MHAGETNIEVDGNKALPPDQLLLQSFPDIISSLTYSDTPDSERISISIPLDDRHTGMKLADIGAHWSIGKQHWVINRSKAKEVSDILEKSGYKPLPLFPNFKDVNSLQVLEDLGGSTGAQLVSYKGKKFVRKKGANSDHIRNEFDTDKAYQVLGFDVPSVTLYNTPQGPVKLAQYIDGAQTLRDFSE